MANLPPDLADLELPPPPAPPRRWLSTGAVLAIVAAVSLLAVVGLGLAASILVPAVLQRLGTAERAKARLDVQLIASALHEYASRNGGHYPEDLRVLAIPDSEGRSYLDDARRLQDPWGRPYLYEPPGPDRDAPRVSTLGRDGEPGGVGADADLDNLSPRDDR